MRMDITERIAQVADIRHPVDDWELGKLVEPLGSEAIAADEAQRSGWRDALLHAYEWGLHPDPVTGEEVDPADLDGDLTSDPVLVTIKHVSGDIAILQARLKALVAYAREFAPPGHKYTLEAIANAAGMSVSGVRTMYDTTTINSVSHELKVGAAKRGADIESRWR